MSPTEWGLKNVKINNLSLKLHHHCMTVFITKKMSSCAEVGIYKFVQIWKFCYEHITQQTAVDIICTHMY
jgi:hypothetical protein